MSELIGILGGMGPLATVDFIHKIIAQTPAKRDQDHLPLLVHSVPQIPDRTACLLESKASPLPALKKGLETLIASGVGCIAIPCNTAHYWYEPLTRISSVPILHIAHACCESLKQQSISSVGLMATDGTLRSGVYSQVLSACNIDLKTPKSTLQRDIMNGIYLVKSGNVIKGANTLEQCMLEILHTGVARIILGCTEIPLALDKISSPLRNYSMDATQELAKMCVDWYFHEVNKSVNASKAVKLMSSYH